MIKRARPLLGTLVEIGVLDDLPSTSAMGAIDLAFEAIQSIHTCMSFHNPDSELSQINRRCSQPVAVSRHTLRVIRLARELSRVTKGAFNCTVGGSLVARGLLPAPASHDALEMGNYSDIQITGHSVTLLRPVFITLDGIAKGYAVDLATRQLKGAGIQSGWINAGGDLRAFGECRLSVGIRHDSGLVRQHTLYNAALATSRIAVHPTARYPAWVVQGQNHTERSASPVRPGDSVSYCSVVAAQAWRADALTKVAACTAEKSRGTFVAKFKGELLDCPLT